MLQISWSYLRQWSTDSNALFFPKEGPGEGVKEHVWQVYRVIKFTNCFVIYHLFDPKNQLCEITLQSNELGGSGIGEDSREDIEAGKWCKNGACFKQPSSAKELHLPGRACGWPVGKVVQDCQLLGCTGLRGGWGGGAPTLGIEPS